MKKLILIFTTWLLVICAQAQFSDDFGDGDFSSAPAWSGDTDHFEVLDGELHLLAPAVEDESILSLSSQAINNAVWEFSVRMDFNPSSGNKTYVYLTSSVADLHAELDGYFVMIGNTDDEVSLYRQDGNNQTKIIDGTDDVVNSNPAEIRVRVSRDAIGNWTLEHDAGLTGSYVTDGSTLDDTYIFSQYFGIRCDYTSTRSDLFYFDDFLVSGDPYLDTTQPSLNSVTVTSSNQLELHFSEALDPLTAEDAAHYFWMQHGFASNAILDTDPSVVHLTFSDDFPITISQTLQVSGIHDLAGNQIEAVEFEFTYFLFGNASEGDLIFNEIMSDPDDIGLLQDAEYLEVYNKTGFSISLSGWTLIDGSTSRPLPEYIMSPQSYLILCNEDMVDVMSPHGEVIGLSGFGLTNSGEYAGLMNDSGDIIDELSWDLDWYKGEEADGVSLERINPELPCSGSGNWTASVSTQGGTPGETNSVLDLSPDITPPVVSNVVYIDENTIDVYFSEVLDDLSVITGSYLVDNEAEVETGVEIIENLGDRVIRLSMNDPFIEGVLYWISFDGLRDCSGNEIAEESIGYFAVPEEVEEGDLVINEILFNERENGTDYVEIYNRSERFISLNGWLISRRDFSGEETDYEISEQYHLIKPGQFILLSENSFKVSNEYPNAATENFIQMASFPAFPNSDGTVLLKTPQEQIHDEFYYSEDYHFALLDDLDGVSLERLEYDRLSNDPTNWHSAAEGAGWGTPGYENSQYTAPIIPESSFLISPEVFSPDNDGVDDVANISYRLDTPGHVANISIFDKRGRLTKQLVRNELLGTSGTFSWDGERDDHTKAGIGIYIVHIEIYDIEGHLISLKKTTVLGGRLSN